MRRTGTMTVLALAMAAGVPASADDLAVSNRGYESDESLVGTLPTEYGNWQGDQSGIVTSQNGIVPFEGSQMLQFMGTHRTGAGTWTGSELWQILDVSAYSSLIASGDAEINAEAWFNRVGEVEGEHTPIDTRFSVTITAYEGTPADFPSLWATGSHLVWSEANLFTDSDVESWERAFASVELPVATDFIAVRIGATENMYNDLRFPEFLGHYADGVGVTIVPTPASGALAACGLLALGGRRRRTAA